jgi:hypothetical protein
MYFFVFYMLDRSRPLAALVLIITFESLQDTVEMHKRAQNQGDMESLMRSTPDVELSGSSGLGEVSLFHILV